MSEPLASLAGLCGVVVGVSSQESIGFHCAKRLGALGAKVAIAHRTTDERAARELASASRAAFSVTLDVMDDASVASAFTEIERKWGKLDFLVHSVVHVPEGVLGRPLLALQRAEFSQVLETAAYSLALLARGASPLLAYSESPRIVALTSACGHRMTPNYHVAGIAKAALESCLLYLAAELGPSGVLCNAVSPALLATAGAVRTVGRVNALATRGLFAKKAPTRKAVEYEDVTGAVAFLCSPLCRNMTGEILTVDGGFSRNYF